MFKYSCAWMNPYVWISLKMEGMSRTLSLWKLNCSKRSIISISWGGGQVFLMCIIGLIICREWGEWIIRKISTPFNKINIVIRPILKREKVTKFRELKHRAFLIPPYTGRESTLVRANTSLCLFIGEKCRLRVYVHARM